MSPWVSLFVTGRALHSLCLLLQAYRFALSAMQNAGIRDVGCYERNYVTADHLGSESSDMSRKSGGGGCPASFDVMNSPRQLM